MRLGINDENKNSRHPAELAAPACSAFSPHDLRAHLSCFMAEASSQYSDENSPWIALFILGRTLGQYAEQQNI